MPRPFKHRWIKCCPRINYYKPRGIPLDELEEVRLGLDEFEAIRLADLEGLYQEEAANKMKISRQTFGNILESAHRKIADAIVNAKALRIDGGVYKITDEKYFICNDCKYSWQISNDSTDLSQCPKCKSTNIHQIEMGRGCRHRNRECNKKGGPKWIR